VTAVDDLQDQVRSAVDTQRPLRIVGGDSKKHIGREPQGDPIDMNTCAGVVDYQPSELVITVRAGTTISRVRQVLAENHQVLACESPEFGGKATVGGTLACNLSGPSRPWLGSIRDHVLGVRIINGRAEHLRFGGQVMKNVAGYDLSRLQAGAMGTLGIVTEVSLKVMPMPETTLTVRRSIGAGDALHVMSEICRKSVPVTGACWYRGDLRVRLAGPTSVVNAAAGRIDGEVVGDDSEFWAGLREMTLSIFAGADDLWCISVRPNQRHFEDDEDWLIDWRGARRWLAARRDRGVLNEFVGEAGGELSHARGAEPGADVFPARSGTYQRTLQRLKHALDPAGIFNPGRLYSWL